MAQERLQGLALLCIESEIATTIDYDSIIDAFAGRKYWKAALWVWDGTAAVTEQYDIIEE